MNYKNLYPFQSHFKKIPDGFALHYLDEGEKSNEALLMVHGNPTWSFFYRDLVKHFKSRYRVIAPDHIGCGLSEKPEASSYPYTLKQRINDLEYLVTELKLDNVTLIVHDWGGMIGMGLATRRPELLKRIVLLNTAAFPKPASKPLPRSIGICRNRLIGPALVKGANAFCLGAAYLCSVKPLSAEIKKGYLAPYSDWKSRAAIFQFVRDIPLTPSHPSFPELHKVASKLENLRSIPRMILWGNKDFVFDHHCLNEWRKIWPDADITEFEDAGHYILEDAQARVIERLEEFFGHAS